ncbi:MAG: host attachment protein [Gammaproteobacteria bacterium]|jgi:hypothetical protein
MQHIASDAVSGASTWVVVADEHRARVLILVDPQTPLREHDRLERVDAGATISASPAAGDGPPGVRTFVVAAARTDGFSQAISAYLDYHRSHGALRHLILVAPPQMLAMLDDTLTPELRELLELEMEDDLVGDAPAAIRARLPDVV